MSVLRLTIRRLPGATLSVVCLVAGLGLFALTAPSSAEEDGDKSEKKAEAAETKPAAASRKPTNRRKPEADPGKKAAEDPPGAAPVEEKADPTEKPAKADDAKEEKKADAEEGEEKPAAPKPNPLGALIRKLLPGAMRPPAAPEAAEPEAKKPANGDATARDPIDARAPHDGMQARRMKVVQRALNEKNWNATIDVLQSILDQPQDSLVRRPDGRWVSVRGEANRILSTLPKEARDQYELKFGAQARHLLQEGSSRDSQDGLAEAATRYFFTQAGQQAADRLAALAYSRGEAHLAADWYRQLLAAGAPVTEGAAWKLRAAAALQQSRDPEAAQRQLAALKSDGGDVQIAGRRIAPDAWWKDAPLTPPRLDASLDEWPVFQGSATRNGIAAGGEPLLLPRWSLPLTASLPVREQLATLVDELSDQKKATVPALFSIMMDDKAVFRTLRGFAVVDVSTGRILWETREKITAEGILSGMTGQTDENGMMRFNMFGGRMTSFMNNGMADQNALISLLYRDGNFGTPAADARRLYVVEKMAVLSRSEQNYGWWNGGNGPPDPFGRDWGSNRITAYDLQTGRPQWELGGEKMREPFDLPLAGTYFFGAPLPDGEELLAIGEESNEIRLHVIDALIGKPIWSQMLAVSDTKVENDFTRRRWVAPVAAGNGVVICPTTVGWLVAVDRTRRSLLWAHRYSEVQPHAATRNFNGMNMTPAGELNTQWSPCAPIIAGNHVVYAPTEEPVLVCLNIADGSLAWKKPKEEGLYVAGVHSDRVVIVGKQNVQAFNITNGDLIWTKGFEEADGRPAGYGVAVGEHYHLPLSTGQLWTLNLRDGTTASKSYLPSGAPALGNLGMYRGLLLSLSGEGLTAFEQRAAIDAEIARRKAKDPKDAWALLREADIALLKRDYPFALERLRQVPEASLEPSDLERFRRNMVDSLASVIRSDFQKHDTEAEELAKFVQTEPEKLLQQRLNAERLHARNDHEGAFRAYLALIERPLDQQVPQGATPVKLRLDLWLAGRFTDLWAEATEETRKSFEALIAERAEAALKGDVSNRRQFCRMFEFHPQSIAVRHQLIEDLASAGQGAEAEFNLLRLARHADPQVAARASERLARLWNDLGYPRDAEQQYTDIERRWPDIALPDGRTVKQTVDALRDKGVLPAPPAPVASWGDFDVRMQRLGSNYVQFEDMDLFDNLSSLPYFRERRFRISPQTQRLTALKAADDTQDWNIALRMRGGAMQQVNWAGTRLVGHSLFVLSRDVLHCLSPFGTDPKRQDVQALWTYTVDNRGASSGYYRQPNRWVPQQMRPTPVSNGMDEANQYGMMAAATERYVCVYGRREFTVLDTVTGDRLWSRGEIPPGTQVFGTADVVFVVLPDRTLALRALDGKELDAPHVRELRQQLVTIAGDNLIVVDQAGGRKLFGLKPPGMAIRAIDPLTGANRWNPERIEFPMGSNFSLLGGDALVALHGAEGSVERVDLVTGVRRVLGKIDEKQGDKPESDMKNRTELYAFEDQTRTYVLVNQPRRGQNHIFGEEIPTIQANGVVVAFDHDHPQRLWKAKVQNQSLVVTQLGHSPVLTFCNRSYVRKNNFDRWQAHILMLDKATGRALVDSTAPTNNGFRALDINMADGYLELKSYNERVRFVRTPRAAAPAADQPKASDGAED
jgi:outer membrane protein assembly factor BamB